MPNPNPSLLDQQQILQRSFDESDDRLRVDVNATVTAGAMEVLINSTSDSIQVKGANGNSIEPNVSGSINTRIQDGSGNNLTSQANGNQRSLDVGINVSGVQIDPRQCYQYALVSTGKMFNFCLNSAALTGITETPLCLFNNPGGSGKSMPLYYAAFSPPTAKTSVITYRIYLNPTVSTNGSSITINGNRQTGQATTVATAFSGPTVSNNGTLLHHTVCVVDGEDSIWDTKFSFILDAGNSILITRELTADATAGGIDFVWGEI